MTRMENIRDSHTSREVVTFAGKFTTVTVIVNFDVDVNTTS